MGLITILEAQLTSNGVAGAIAILILFVGIGLKIVLRNTFLANAKQSATLVVSRALYNVYLHPLSRYPGPKWASATRLWYCYHTVQGNLHTALRQAHQKYGDVVRIAPSELSYTDARAWNDIYGHRVGKGELIKDQQFYANMSSGPGSIINADRIRHGHLRKQASHGFSERALRSREHVVVDYANMMLDSIQKLVVSGHPVVDIVDWYNFFTFDVMGDMVFGQSFNCLRDGGYHPWVKLIFDSVKAGAFARCVKYWPMLKPIARFLVPAEVRRRRAAQRKMAKDKAAYRKSIDDGRQDLISGYLLPESGVTDLEYQSTVETLIIAGSETTATLMSGFTYYILRDAARLAKLNAEIRETFSSIEEIDFTSVNQLPYLLACLNEALRVYSPVADTFPRNTGAKEEIICGNVVPPWTIVGVNHWSTYHSERNFKDPDEFVPERWLPDKKQYGDDKLEAAQPFHVGGRNCLGRNLAFFEMRIMIARLFWRYDLELDPRSANWNQQKAYLLWEKPPMYVKVTPRLILSGSQEERR